MQHMCEEAANVAGVPAELREEVIGQVRSRLRISLRKRIADEMHEILMDRAAQNLAQDGTEWHTKDGH